MNTSFSSVFLRYGRSPFFLAASAKYIIAAISMFFVKFFSLFFAGVAKGRIFLFFDPSLLAPDMRFSSRKLNCGDLCFNEYELEIRFKSYDLIHHLLTG